MRSLDLIPKLPCRSHQNFLAAKGKRSRLPKRKRLLAANYSKKHSDVLLCVRVGHARLRHAAIKNDVTALLAVEKSVDVSTAVPRRNKKSPTAHSISTTAPTDQFTH
jgi:hypothetical protein